MLNSVDNVGEIRNRRLAVFGSSGWHFLVHLAVLTTSSFEGLLDCWLEPLAKFTVSGALDCKSVGHASQLLCWFFHLGSLKAVFKPTIKLTKYNSEPNFGYSVNILSFLFCQLAEPGWSPKPQNR